MSFTSVKPASVKYKALENVDVKRPKAWNSAWRGTYAHEASCGKTERKRMLSKWPFFCETHKLHMTWPSATASSPKCRDAVAKKMIHQCNILYMCEHCSCACQYDYPCECKDKGQPCERRHAVEACEEARRALHDAVADNIEQDVAMNQVTPPQLDRLTFGGMSNRNGIAIAAEDDYANVDFGNDGNVDVNDSLMVSNDWTANINSCSADGGSTVHGAVDNFTDAVSAINETLSSTIHDNVSSPTVDASKTDFKFSAANDTSQTNPHGGSLLAWETVQLMQNNTAPPIDDCFQLSKRLQGENHDLHHLECVCRIMQCLPPETDMSSITGTERILDSMIASAATGMFLSDDSQKAQTIHAREACLRAQLNELRTLWRIPQLVTHTVCGEPEEFGLRKGQTQVAICNLPYQLLMMLRKAGVQDADGIHGYTAERRNGIDAYGSPLSGKAAATMQKIFDTTALPDFGDLACKHTALPLTLFVDATHMASGRKIEGVYMALAQDRSARAFLGYLPTGIHQMASGYQRDLLYQIGLANIIMTLRAAFIRGVVLRIGSDNVCLHPYVLLAPVDWKAAHEMAGYSTGATAEYNCLHCSTPTVNQIESAYAATPVQYDHCRADCAYQFSRSVVNSIPDAAGGSRSAMKAAITAMLREGASDYKICLQAVPNFLALLPVSPSCSGWTVCVSEPLHLLYHGLVRDTLDKCGELFKRKTGGAINAQERFNSLLSIYPGIREGGKIERGGKWFDCSRRSGKLARRVLYYLPALLADMKGFTEDTELAPRIIQVIKSLAELERVTTLSVYTDAELFDIAQAARNFVTTASDIAFNVERPKVHLLMHLHDMIQVYGSPIHWDGAGFESLHVQLKRMAFGNSGCLLRRWEAIEKLRLYKLISDIVINFTAMHADEVRQDLDNWSDDSDSSHSDDEYAGMAEALVLDGSSNIIKEKDVDEPNSAPVSHEIYSVLSSECASYHGQLDPDEHPALEAQEASTIICGTVTPATTPPFSIQLQLSDGADNVRATQPDGYLAVIIRQIFSDVQFAYRVCRINGITYAHTNSFHRRPRADACIWTDRHGTTRLGFFIAWCGTHVIMQQLELYWSTEANVTSRANGSLLLHQHWHAKDRAIQVKLSGKWFKVEARQVKPATVVPLISLALLDQRGKYHVSRLICSSRWVHTRAATNYGLTMLLAPKTYHDGTPSRTWLWMRAIDHADKTAIRS